MEESRTLSNGTNNRQVNYLSNPPILIDTLLANNQLIELDYDPILVNCFEGLLETDHPYSFVANRAIHELLQAPGASDKTIPITGKLIMPLRSSFMSADNEIWMRGLEALRALS